MTAEIQSLKQLANDQKNKDVKPQINDDEGNNQSSDDNQDEFNKENTIGPANTLRELGPTVASSMDNLIKNFQQFQKWSNADVYRCLEVISVDSSEQKDNSESEEQDKNLQGEWNVDLFIDFLLKKIFPQNNELNWNAVLQELDRPNMKLKDEKSFKQFFLNLQVVNKKSPFQMPSNIFTKRWKYGKSQIFFLRSMLNLGQTDILRWNEIQKTPMNLEFNSNYKYGSLQPPALQFWACIDILEVLLDLSEGDNFDTVLEIFESPIAKYPDILIVGLSQISIKKGNALLDELFSQLFPNYLSNHVNSVQILEAIWKNNDELLINAISELYKKENKKENTSLNLSRVLDISQYIKDSLIALTNCSDYSFSVSLGILAGKREFLHFDQWLNERVKTVGDPFVSALLQYVEDNVIIPIKEIQARGNVNNFQHQYEGVLEKAQLTIEILTIIFESLLVEQQPEKLSIKNMQKLQEQYKEVLQYFPQLVGSNDSPGQGTEKKANYNFQRFYTREVTLEEMITNLKQLMNSNSSEDREVFACMITSLIEEAKYHVQYPVLELLLTGQLQGSIIAAGLVNQKPLGILLEQILESSKKSQRQVEFAVKAIEAMKERLHEFPNFVNALFDQSCHLSEQYPQLLIQIYNQMNEKKVQINVSNKQVEYLKQRVDQLKNDSSRTQPQQGNSQNQQLSKKQQTGQTQQIGLEIQQSVTIQPQQQQQLKQTDFNSVYSEPAQIQANSISKAQQEAIKSNDPSLQKTGSVNFLGVQPEEKQTSDNAISNPVKKKLKNSKKVFDLGIDSTPSQQNQSATAQVQQQNQTNEAVQANQGGQQQQQQYAVGNEGLYGQIGFPTGVGSPGIGVMGHNGYGGINSGPINPSTPNLQNTILIGGGNQVVGLGGASQQQYDSNMNVNDDLMIKSKPYQGGVGFIQRPVFANGEFQSYTQKKLTEIREQEDKDSIQIEENIKKKVVFALNNLTDTNLDKHQNDLRNFAENDNFLKWFAKYLVLWRATLYSEIEKIDKSQLFKYIINDSLLLLHKFLLSELDIQPTDRNMLKSLGTWIGMLTLNRNKSINSKYLNIKALIINSYPNRIDIIIPIVINILLQSKDTKIFNPQKNVWIKRIFSLLEEFKNTLQKETVKHQINQLFNILQVDVNSLEQCTFFRYYVNEIKKADKTASVLQQSTNIIERLIISEEFNIIKGFDLKQAVFLSLDDAIKEIIQPVISRSVTIALITTRELTLKDYCTDPDENNLLNGIQTMVQKLSGSLALITCKDPLKQSFLNHLKGHLEKVTEIGNNEKEQLINRVVNDNLDIGCSEIRQRVMDQALKDIKSDELIIEAIEMRRLARQRQQIFVDEKYYKFTQKLPLLLQPKIPGSFTHSDVGDKSTTNDNLLNEYNTTSLESFKKIMNNLNLEQENVQSASLDSFFKKTMFSDKLFSDIVDFIFQNIFKSETQKIKNYVDILDKLRESFKSKEKIGKILKENLFNNTPLDTATKQSLHQILNTLIFKKLITVDEYQEIILLLLTRNHVNDTIICITSALREIIFDRNEYTPTDFNDSIIALKLTMSSRQDTPPQYTQFLLALNRYNLENASQNNNIITFESALDVITSLYGNFDQQFYQQTQEKVEQWLSFTTHSQISSYIKTLESTIFTTHDDSQLKFFVYFADICVNHALDSAKKNQKINIQSVSNMDFTCIDCFTKLIEIIQKTFVNEDKKHLLNRIYESIFIVLTKYHETDIQEFNQRPFFRIFFNLIYDNQRPQYNFQKNEISETYNILAKIFHQLSPVKYPGFAFSWLELVSNRYFIPVIMEKEESWGLYCQLMIDLIKFFKEVMQEQNLQQDYIKIFYRGTVRVLLVLLHDWPDFLAKFSNSLCDEIPENYVQIRNIVLAAFPKQMKPPDPFSSNNEQIFENNEDFKNPPPMDYSVFNEKLQHDISNDLQNYMRLKSEDIFKSICSKMLLKEQNSFVIDQKAVNVLILSIPYFLFKAFANSNDIKAVTLKNDLYNLLMKLLKTSHYEMREAILSLIINQVRYPNFITKFYIKFILLTFQEQNILDIQEQTTRIIVERLFVQKPHPWGIIYTFIEIIKSSSNFRTKPFFVKTELRQVFRFIYEQPKQQKPPQQVPQQEMSMEQQMHLNNMQMQMIQQQQQQQQQAPHPYQQNMGNINHPNYNNRNN